MKMMPEVEARELQPEGLAEEHEVDRPGDHREGGQRHRHHDHRRQRVQPLVRRPAGTTSSLTASLTASAMAWMSP